MSTDYNPGVFYGVFLSQDDVMAMTVTIPEKTAPCFDKRTGKKVADEVIDGEHQALVIDGHRYSDFGCQSEEGSFEDGLLFLAGKVGLVAVSMEDKWGETYGYVIGRCLDNADSKEATETIRETDELLKKLPARLKRLNGPGLLKAKIHAYMSVE